MSIDDRHTEEVYKLLIQAAIYDEGQTLNAIVYFLSNFEGDISTCNWLLDSITKIKKEV